MISRKGRHRRWGAKRVPIYSRPGRSPRLDGLRSAAKQLSTDDSQPEARKAAELRRIDGGQDGGGDLREPHSSLYPDALEKLSAIFGKHLAEVLVKHRKVETLTGEKNIIGRQNLVEALAHLGTLFARAPDLNRDEQLEQVAFLGDHLRRVMMESFEVEVYATIGDHWNEDDPKSIGRRYDAVAAPLVKQGKLLGVIAPDEVQERFDALSDSIVEARRAKIADGDWSAWADAADSLEAAAAEMRKLKREMGSAVDAANERRYHRRLMLGGVGLSVIFGVIVTLAAQALGAG